MASLAFDARAVVREAAAPTPSVPPRRQLWLKLAVVGVDAASVALGMALAFVAREWLPTEGLQPARGRDHLALGALALPFWVAIFAHYRLYRTRHVQSRLQEFKRVVNAVGASVLAMTFVGTMLEAPVSRGWLLLCLPTTVLTVMTGRVVVRRVFEGLRGRGHLQRSVVIVGTNPEADALRSMLEGDPKLGYQVVGLLAGKGDLDGRGQHSLVPAVADVVDTVRRTGATGVLIATTSVDLDTANRLARHLTEVEIHVELSSSLRDIAAERLTLRLLGRCPVVYVEPVRRTGWRAAAKRTFDTSMALVGLFLALPVLAAAAAWIKLDSEGPVFFRQKRVGRDGKLFEVIKLRTMVIDAEDLKDALRSMNEAGGPLFKIRDDPRVTRPGRLLRTLSIDELPQLWNVVKGEMSLVGPRPAIPAEAERWDPELHHRVRVRPGLTGMWQVNGRSSSSFEDYVRFDLYYVDNWSFWTDLAIIAKTVPVLLSRRGAC